MARTNDHMHADQHGGGDQRDRREHERRHVAILGRKIAARCHIGVAGSSRLRERYQPSQPSGSTNFPSFVTSKCRCAPVEFPVDPRLPIWSPVDTLSPTETPMPERWL